MMSLRLLFLLLLLPVCVMAAEKPNLVLNLKAEKEVAVTGKDGKTRFEWRESSVLDPGNVVRYTLFYTNSGSSEARNAVIVDPVPAGTTYVAGSAEGKGSEISFSMDGKQFSPPTMLKYRVKGKSDEMSAIPEMYTHIKWKLVKPVPPGGNGSVSFSVKVK